jgi:arylsulfatase A-like enzyme
MRVPLIVAGPLVPAGQVLDAPAHGIDITPTLLALLGVPSSTPRDGLDLSPAWRGAALPERTFFAEADYDSRSGRPSDVRKMARRGGTKLLSDASSRVFELYDLTQDPLERVDRSREEPERVAALRAELERHLAGAIEGEAIAPPTEEEQGLLDELGYGGETDEK